MLLTENDLAQGFVLSSGRSHRTEIRNNSVSLIGAPGIYDPEDSHHDQSWFSYVDLIMKQARDGELDQKDHIRWLVFEPGYRERWEDDSKEPSILSGIISRKTLSSERYRHTRIVKEYGASDYVDYIRKKSIEYNKRHGYLIDVIGLNSARDFWEFMLAFKPLSVKSVMYVGHAQNQLWLRLLHKDHEPIPPNDEEIVKLINIDVYSDLRSRFASSSRSLFHGCNTAMFAKKWSEVFGVHAEGAEGSVWFDRHNLKQVRDSAEYGWKVFEPTPLVVPVT